MSIPYPPGEALTAQQIRELDLLAIEHVGIPGIVLMENAARGAAQFLFGLLPNPARERVVVLCGPGNNGGDGFAVARHLTNGGVSTTVVLASPAAKIAGDAAVNLRIIERMSIPIIDAGADRPAAEQALRTATWIVDALLGTGGSGSPRGVMADLIRAANGVATARRVAIDLPSGLQADSGDVFDPCFRADATVTFVAAKTGFVQPAAAERVGRIHVVEIGIPRNLIPGRAPTGNFAVES